MAQQPLFQAGDECGGYAICELLHTTHSSEVYRARHHTLKRNVALKVSRMQVGTASPAEVQEAQLRAVLEAEALARCQHPNIVTIYEVGRTWDGGAVWIAMELIDGDTLEEAGAQSIDKAVEIVCAVADGLAKAHAMGIVHRDLKPTNILLTPEGPKIIDFGTAKVRGHDMHTEENEIFGSPLYMAPEQIRGDHDIDARADVYTLGMVLYEMLIGYHPFRRLHSENERTAFSEVIYLHLHVSPPPLEGLPDGLWLAVEKAIQKDRTARFQTMASFAAALRDQDISTLTAGGSLPASARSMSPRAPRRIVLEAVATAVIAGGMLVALLVAFPFGTSIWQQLGTESAAAAVVPESAASTAPAVPETVVSAAPALPSIAEAPVVSVVPVPVQVRPTSKVRAVLPTPAPTVAVAVSATPAPTQSDAPSAPTPPMSAESPAPTPPAPMPARAETPTDTAVFPLEEAF